MKIGTWNVHSLSVRLPHVLHWLDANQPDILGLQGEAGKTKARWTFVPPNARTGRTGWSAHHGRLRVPQ